MSVQDDEIQFQLAALSSLDMIEIIRKEKF